MYLEKNICCSQSGGCFCKQLLFSHLASLKEKHHRPWEKSPSFSRKIDLPSLSIFSGYVGSVLRVLFDYLLLHLCCGEISSTNFKFRPKNWFPRWFPLNYFLFSPLPGGFMIQFDDGWHIFQMGGKKPPTIDNHQPIIAKGLINHHHPLIPFLKVETT